MFVKLLPKNWPVVDVVADVVVVTRTTTKTAAAEDAEAVVVDVTKVLRLE